MTTTKSAPSTGAALIVLLVVAFGAVAGWTLLTNPEGPDHLPPMPEDDNQVFVDMAAVWTPQRDMDVNWQIGAHIQGERFNASDPGRWALRIALDRGTEVVLLVEPGSRGGQLSCEIRVNEREQVVEDNVSGTKRCRVELVT